eukprot:g6047.t1
MRRYTLLEALGTLLCICFVNASKDSHDDDFFFENLPRYDSPILEASEKTEMESVAGWKLAEIYNENALLHKDVETPYDSIKIIANTKDREVLTTVRNNAIKKALLRSAGTDHGEVVDSIDEMIDLLELKILSVTSDVDISSSRSKREKAEKVTRKYKYGEVQGNKLSNLWLQLGNAQRALGNVNKAILCFRKCYSLDPSNDHATASLGAMLRSRGGVKGAKELFEIARRNVPDSSLFAHHLGEVLRKMNKLNAAVENYDDAVKLNPTFHAAKKRLHELEKRGIFPNSKIQSNIFFLIYDDFTIFFSSAYKLVAENKIGCCFVFFVLRKSYFLYKFMSSRNSDEPSTDQSVEFQANSQRRGKKSSRKRRKR